MDFKDKLEKRLLSGKFRLINEKVYKSNDKLTNSDLKTYHEGFQQQTKKWDLSPLTIIKRSIDEDKLTVDIGCGEAELEKTFKNVLSIDKYPVKKGILCADMRCLPLQNEIADCVVFCLSLMENVDLSISEGRRILKKNGILIIAEVVSRVKSVDEFVKNCESVGLKCLNYCENGYFFVCEFSKVSKTGKKMKIKMKPCLYKRR